MTNDLGITHSDLGAYLGAHLEGFQGPFEMSRLVAGQSNPTFLIKAASGRYVLRAKPPGMLLKSAHMVDREYRVMAALAGSDVPVPRVFHLATDADSPIGRAFFVMEYLDGRIFWDPSLPDVTMAQRAGFYDAMNATLAALHDVDPVEIGLSDFGKPGNYFARQTDRWTRQYTASVTGDNPDMNRLIKWLEDNMPDDDGQISLVHGDYRLDNMVFHHDRAQVIGLLDWELSTLGHPLADLAYQCMQWRLPHEAGMRGLGGLDRAALGIPDEDAYVAAYCARRGIDRPDNWAFYLGFSFFRLAAILEGVVARARAGNAANPEKARQYESAIPVLVGLALAGIGEET
ncbi:MAG TPA: phosphotransferase family protein [Aliiroseovarius sp.]|nr:phosphotransferase family protein [Aliiroseovarius sp.]